MNDDWGSYAQTNDLTDVRVVAILDEGGGAIIEHHPALELHEGRLETYGVDGKGQKVSSLNYGLTFAAKDVTPGDSHIGYDAQIVIRGTASNGRLMEVRGRGTIGHDEHGNLDGVFDEVPAIYVPDEKDVSEHLERLTDLGRHPKGEFVWATYGRAQDWS